jgi:hypothetical protein
MDGPERAPSGAQRRSVSVIGGGRQGRFRRRCGGGFGAEQAEADARQRPEQLSTVECGELKRLRKENSELKRADDILKAASAYFAA